MRRVLVVLMLAVMVGAQIPAAAEERLPTDPALVTGTLPNGLSTSFARKRIPRAA